MKSSKLKKLCAVLMAATLSTTLFLGCGSTSSKEGNNTNSESKTTTNKDANKN